MFTDKLDKLLQSRGLNKHSLALETGIPYTTIDGWYKKGCGSMKLSTLCKLADFFDVSIDYLLGRISAPVFSSKELELVHQMRRLDSHGRRVVKMLLDEECRRIGIRDSEEAGTCRMLPHYLSMPAAGYAAPIEGEDFELREAPPSVPKNAQFSVTISGDSMEPYIKNGQTVYCTKDSEGVHIGDVGIFCVDGQCYCKQYCTDGENIYLLSLNRKRADADVTIWGSGNQSVSLLGRVLLDRKLPMP